MKTTSVYDVAMVEGVSRTYKLLVISSCRTPPTPYILEVLTSAGYHLWYIKVSRLSGSVAP